MPITLTVQGHEEIIASLQGLSERLQGPEVVNILAQETSIIMAQNAPVGRRGMMRGQLQRTMSEVGGPAPTEGGWWAGVGSLEGIYPLEPAPKGTIRAFLDIIRKFRRKSARPRSHFFEPQKAWWFLSEKEKSALRLLRETGRADVGGSTPYRPKYWFIQEAGMPEVGIGGQGYIAKTITAIKGRIGQIVTNILVSRGPVTTG